MKGIGLLLLFFLLFSCDRKEPNFSKEMIEILVARGEIKNDSVPLPPPPIFFSDVHLQTNCNEIIFLNENELFSFYKKYYFNEFKSFADFLNAFLNDGYLVDKSVLIDPKYPRRFKLNSKIEKEYSELGFNEFLKKYSKPSSRKKELILNKSDLKEGQYLSVTCLLYVNKYDISSDCYLGVDYIRKREDSFK